MSHTITMGQGAFRFDCDPGQTILDAALRANLEVPFSCCRGICGSCRAVLASGDVQQRAPLDGLTDAQRAAGYVLMCRSVPLGDCVVEPESVQAATQKRKRLRAKVYRVRQAARDVTVLTLRLPIGVRAKFRAGQYLRVWLDDENYREFSMANTPKENDSVELHIRTMPEGRFTTGILPGLSASDAVEIELPYGDFYLRPGTAPIVLVASGTGFAPIKSLIEAAFAEGDPRPMTLYWGGRRREDLYMMDLPEQWQARHPHFRFVPVLSEADDEWQGRRGFVHAAALEDHASLAENQAYVCGVPAMVKAARTDFTALRGLPPESFFCDAFVSGPSDATANNHMETLS